MAISFKFYKDSGLTQEISVANPLYGLQKSDGSLAPVVQQVWYGSVANDKQVEATSNPGVDQIVVSVEDANALTGQPTTAVKMALTEVGLATAVAGDPLALGTSLLSGVAQAVSFWVELDDQTTTAGLYEDLKLISNMLDEINTA